MKQRKVKAKSKRPRRRAASSQLAGPIMRPLHASFKDVPNMFYRIRRFLRYDDMGTAVYGPWEPWVGSRNLTINSGRDAAKQQVHNPAYAANTKVAQYIAVTIDTATPVATDSTLASEQTTNGLQRAAGTYSDGGSTGAWQQQITMTYTGSAQIVLAKSAVFDASSSGNMYYEALYATVATLNQNDQIQTTWTGNMQAA